MLQSVIMLCRNCVAMASRGIKIVSVDRIQPFVRINNEYHPHGFSLVGAFGRHWIPISVSYIGIVRFAKFSTPTMPNSWFSRRRAVIASIVDLVLKISRCPSGQLWNRWSLHRREGQFQVLKILVTGTIPSVIFAWRIAI